ncbi:MAG: beta-lactamase family protein [Ramlibacter sp.]|nr:beta-lactamase family protein [Cryobacterium sp.]
MNGRGGRGDHGERGERRRHHRWAVLVVGAVLLLSGCTPADDAIDVPAQVETPLPAELTARLDAALAEAIALSGSTGALAGVWVPWAGTWVVAPGTTATTVSLPLDTGMSFRIGNNTAPMTCTVLLRLVEEGTVALDDLVSTHLTRLVGIDGITLGQLCGHTSGLADFTRALAPQFVGNPTRVWPTGELLANGMGLPRVATTGEAGTSDTGLVLLGLALQEATHQDWTSLYQRYILRPLGLTGTSLPGPQQLEIAGGHPNGYATVLDQAGNAVCGTVVDVTALSPSMAGVAGGAVSNLADLKTWTQSLARGSLLTEKQSEAQWAAFPARAGAPDWRREGLGGLQLGPLRGQTGSIPGFISAAFADPSSGLTVVVAFNNSTSGRGFAEAAARPLLAIASTAPAAAGEQAPVTALPWSEDEATQAVQAAMVCPPAAPAG